MTALYPKLIIGQFPAEYRLEYKRLENISDVRNFVANYWGADGSGKLLVLGDLFFLSMEAQFVLLKFIEETPFDVVVHSSQDKISPIILSRFMTIQKKVEPLKSMNFKPAADIFADTRNDPNRVSRMKLWAEAPILFVYKQTFWRDAYIDFLI